MPARRAQRHPRRRHLPMHLRKDPPCSALTRPAPCAPTTQARPSRSPGGWRGVETTAASPSSTCATARGVAQVVARDEVLARGGAHDVRNEFCVKVTGEVRERPEGNANPDLPTGDIEVIVSELEVLNPSAPLPFQIDERVTVGEEARLKHRYLDLRRPGASSAGAAHPAALAGQRRRPLGARCPRLRRDRDADPDPLDARGRARLPRARAARPGVLVRPAAEPAAVQAAAHGRRDGALLPDRPLLPRRGLPRRPPAGVHPARHRDVLRRAGRRHRARRGRHRRALEAHRRRAVDARSSA